MSEGIGQDAVGSVYDAKGTNALRCVGITDFVVASHWFLGQADESAQVKGMSPIQVKTVCFPDVGGEIGVLHRLSGLK